MSKTVLLLSAFLLAACASSTKALDVTPETRTKIVIIDTGLLVTSKMVPYLCKDDAISFVVDSPFSDPHGHGSCVAGLIAENLDPKKQCIVIVKFWERNMTKESLMKNIAGGVRYAIKIKASFINMSLSGGSPIAEEEAAIRDAVKNKIKIAVSAGNSHQNLDKRCDTYPTCYKKLNSKYFHVVGSSTGTYSNTGKIVKFKEDGTKKGSPEMSGTSMSTAIHTGKWASGKLK